jgi:hypothetical protein
MFAGVGTTSLGMPNCVHRLSSILVEITMRD